MSSSSIKRKLLPAKNAWKKLATMLRSKIFRLKRSKAFKRTATGLNAAVSTMLGRRRRHPPRFRVKRHALTRLPPDPGRNQKGLHHHHGFMPVYADELFNTTPVHIQLVQPAVFVGKVLVDKAASRGAADEGPSSQIIKADQLPAAVGTEVTVVNPGKSAPRDLISGTKVEPSSTVGMDQLEGVDLRAELFIAKFKEEMRLQRQRSFDEYQRMLARGL